jgi:hypothetical protein
MNNLEEIRDYTIKKGFPELLAENITISYAHLKDAFLICGDLKDEGYFIKVTPILKKAPKDVIIGGVAHELAHILDAQSRNKHEKATDAKLYRFSKTYRTMTERNTDLQTIIRDFGAELLAFMKYYEKTEPHYKEDGLSIREIQKLLELNKLSV